MYPVHGLNAEWDCGSGGGERQGERKRAQRKIDVVGGHQHLCILENAGKAITEECKPSWGNKRAGTSCTRLQSSFTESRDPNGRYQSGRILVPLEADFDVYGFRRHGARLRVVSNGEDTIEKLSSSAVWQNLLDFGPQSEPFHPEFKKPRWNPQRN